MVRIFLVAFLGVALLLNNGCAVYEMETTNRGGYIDSVLDKHWLKADSKSMRALRAFAMQVSLARVASVAAKNESDRQLLAIRIGALTKRFVPIYLCAFNTNPLGVPGAQSDPCFYYDSAMVDYSTGLFDLAMIALPIEDAQKLITQVAGSSVNPINVIELLGNLLQIGKDAIKLGRIVGALYRDTVELEVQVWLGTPAIDRRAPPYQVTEADVASLREVYARGNDNMPAWLAEMAALRGRGLEPIPQPKFFGELAGLLNYMCDLITRDAIANSPATCKANLPETLPPPSQVIGTGPAMRIGDVKIPSAAFLRNPSAATTGTRVNDKKDTGTGPIDPAEAYKKYLKAYNPAVDSVTRIEKALSALCVPKKDYNQEKKVTDLIRAYEGGVHQGSSAARADGLLDSGELAALNAMGQCDSDFRNAYERLSFPSKTAKGVADLLTAVPDVGKVADGDTLQSIRPKIIAARKKLNMEDPLVPDQITQDLVDRMSPQDAPKTERKP